MRQLGGYTLTHRLGVGGMGEVWLGRREALGGAAVDAAIKVLSRGKVNDDEARRMFLDEARLSMLLTASNIVKVFDAGEAEDGTCYMVMEWVDGLNLAQLNKQLARAGEWYSDTLIAYIVGEILKGLAHAHDLRHRGERVTIVHRDISAHNVMCSVNGEVKVMDFGIARVASEDTSGVHVKGKLRYMPPEQLRGETRKPTLDLFAAGAILHELLDGVPFRSRVLDEGHLYGMIVAGETPSMQRDPETIPLELEQLRQSLLASDPLERVQSAREAFEWLSNWSGYRDARFELDEIVRRHAEARAAASPAAPASPPSNYEVDVTTPYMGPSASRAAGSFSAGAALASASSPRLASVSASGSAAAAAMEATAVVDKEASNSQLHVAATPIVVPRERRPIVVGLVSLGVALLGLGYGAMALQGEGVPPELTASEDPPATPSAASQPAAATEPDSDPEPAPGAQVQPVEAAVEPTAVEATPTAQETAPTSSPAAKVKVSLSLSSDVKWVEIKLGSRKIVLDGFDKKSGSTRLAPGRYALSSRTQFDGPWHRGPSLRIEAGVQVSIRVQKGGVLSLR